MNAKPSTGKYFLPTILVICFSVALIAWGGQKQPHQQKTTNQNITDTVPKAKVDKKIRDLDDVIDELDKAELKVNMDKVNAELGEAMKKIDMAKIKMDVDKAMKEVDLDKIKAEVEKATKEMEEAKVEMEKAKIEMKEYKSFVDALDKDGLINKKEGYTIQHKNGELIINGKKQPADVYSKYRPFLEKHAKFTIKKSDDDFNIDNDNND